MTQLPVHVLQLTERMYLAAQSQARIRAIEERYTIPSFDRACEAMGDIAPESTLSTICRAGEDDVSHALRGGFDQIAMGSRGYCSSRELLLDRISLQVLHRAHCPVIVVR